jgi:hypothetical protein
MSEFLARFSFDRLLAISGGVLAASFSLVFQSPGVVLSPDGWAYWEGSVSMLSGDGYRYLDGAPILAWPPGFSAYLALWQLVLGNAAGTLAMAHAVAMGVGAAVWIGVARRIAPSSRPTPAGIAAAVVLALLPAICLRAVLSESLFMALLGGSVAMALGGGRVRGTARTALFATLVAAMLLTRHVGAAFVPALAWIAWRSRVHAPLRDNVRVAIAAASAVALWFVVRLWLGLLDNNARMAIDSNAPARIVESVLANLQALASCFLPTSPAAATAVAIVASVVAMAHGLGGRGSRATSQLAAAAALPVATAIAAAIASVTWAIHGVSGRRFVLPLAVLFVLVLVRWGSAARRRAGRRLANATLVAFAVVQLARGGYWVVHATSSGQNGLDWSARLVRPCPPGLECQLAPEEIEPRERPWLKWRPGSSSPP